MGGSVWRRIAVDVTPLRHPAFRRLWIGQSVSFVGFQLSSVAVAGQIYDITSSSFWVGMLGPASLIPLVIFGLWGGAVADAVDRRRLLLWGSVIAWTATVALLLHAVLRLDDVVLMLAAMAVHATGFAITGPVRGAIIPRLVPVAEVPAANPLNVLSSRVGSVVGPLIAGVVLNSSGYTAAYLIDALLFATGFYAAVRLPSLPPLGATRRPGARAVAEGLRFLAGHPVVLMPLAVDISAIALRPPRAP